MAVTLRRGRRISLLSKGAGCVAAWATDRYGPSHSGALVRDFVGESRHAQYGSSSGSDSNDPTLYQPDRGRAYAVFPGVSGNYISRAVPSGWESKSGGSFTLLARIYLDSVTPSANTAWQGAGSTGRIIFQILTTGVLNLQFRDGANVLKSSSSSVAVGFSAGQWVWVKVDVDLTSQVVKFYTSTTGTDDPAAAVFTQLGADVASAATTISPSVTSFVVGMTQAAASGGNPMSGGIRYAAWYLDGALSTGIDLTDLRNYNATQTRVLGLSGNSWTITRPDGTGRPLIIVDSPLLGMGTDDYLLVANDAAFNPGANSDFTAFALTRMWQVSGTGIVIGKKATTGSGDAGWSVEFSSAEAPVARVSDGSTQVTATGTAPTVGICRISGIRVRRATQTVEAFAVAADGALSLASASISSVGAITNSAALTMGADPSAGSRFSGTWKGAGYFNRALSDAELRQLPQAMYAGFIGF